MNNTLYAAIENTILRYHYHLTFSSPVGSFVTMFKFKQYSVTVITYDDHFVVMLNHNSGRQIEKCQAYRDSQVIDLVNWFFDLYILDVKNK